MIPLQQFYNMVSPLTDETWDHILPFYTKGIVMPEADAVKEHNGKARRYYNKQKNRSADDVS